MFLFLIALLGMTILVCAIPDWFKIRLDIIVATAEIFIYNLRIFGLRIQRQFLKIRKLISRGEN